MKYMRMSNQAIYYTLDNCGYDIKFIDNKWFINGVEYPLEGAKGIKWIIYKRLPMVFRNIDEVSKWLEWFKENNK